ncbi:MAG: glycosyltransferase [Deltaproteobacteria bacterium]|nr:glycosyltransferase [Deltaproteobacteria bacterium]
MLHLLDSLPVGGAEALVAAVVRGLDAGRFDVQAATIGPAGVIGEELRRAGYPVHALGLSLKKDPDLKIIHRIRQLLKHLRPDILHTHLYHPNYYGRLAALGMGLKGVVASIHNVYTRRKFHRRLWNFLLSWTTDRIVAVSPQVRRDVLVYDAVPPSRLDLLPNGINLAALDIQVSREAAKAQLGVNGLCLGAVGRLEEQKGHALLLEAFPAVIAEVGDITLLLAGDGKLRPNLERQAEDLGITGRVKFLGTRRDMPLVYRAMDIMALPSLWEGLPLALLEAMGAGLPVVASRVGGVKDVISDGINGRLIPAGDPQALAAAIVELSRRPDRRTAMGNAAQETIKKRFSQEVMLQKLAELYQELAEGRNSSQEKATP